MTGALEINPTNHDVQRVAVLGAGSWGTTFAKVLADAGRKVQLWARRPDVAASITERHRNPAYLTDVELPASLTASADPGEVLDGADAVVFAVPSQSLRANLESWRDRLPDGVTLVSLAKGVELGSLKRIAHEEPTATVIACPDHDRAVALQSACSTDYFKAYTNTDVVGCELGGAGKNVIALAVGVAAGMGLGDNSRASLITRGLAEMSRLGVALGANPLTFAGLAGMGDLVATC